MSKKFPKDLGRRTPGEDLWLARKAAGKTAEEAASLAGVCRGSYRDAERDRDPARIAALGRILPEFEATLPLLLALCRRRSGYDFAKLRRATRRTKPTILAWERAGDPRLVAFWRARGFRFPAGAA